MPAGLAARVAYRFDEERVTVRATSLPSTPSQSRSSALRPGRTTASFWRTGAGTGAPIVVVRTAALHLPLAVDALGAVALELQAGVAPLVALRLQILRPHRLAALELVVPGDDQARVEGHLARQRLVAVAVEHDVVGALLQPQVAMPPAAEGARPAD